VALGRRSAAAAAALAALLLPATPVAAAPSPVPAAATASQSPAAAAPSSLAATATATATPSSLAATATATATATAAAAAPSPTGHADRLPDLVKAATVGAASITAGRAHSCAITSIGAVYCWGANANGQLGDGQAPNGSTTAVAATGTGDLTGIAVQVDAGAAHTCAIDTAGLAYCWGANSAGQLGNGDGPDQDTPVRVDALQTRTLVEITTGDDHSCAIDDQGAVWCWGDDAHGQLGAPGLGASTSTPVQVSTATGMTDPVVDIAAGGDTTCAATATGKLYCWGQGDQGEVGDGASADRSEPVAVSTGTTVRQVAVGAARSCAVDADGSAFCWGAGIGAQPAAVDAGGTKFLQVAVGGAHMCGLDRDDTAYCWGDGDDGAIGDGSTVDRADPVLVAAGDRVPGATLRDIEAGDRHSCALDDGGVAYCWGADTAGQLGNAASGSSSVPVRVRGLPRAPAAVTGLTVTALDGGLRVSWHPAGDFGTGTFKSYLAVTSNFEATCTVAAPAGAGCDLTGLDGGHAYDVAVLTLTSDGSALSSFATAAPDAAASLPPSAAPTEPHHDPGLPDTGSAPLLLIAIGTLFVGLGMSLLLVRTGPGRRLGTPRRRP
jgi:alpha-tubulin suppressor-like RCC1 family protein